MNRVAFFQQIYRNWADYFGCGTALFEQRGTTLCPIEEYAGRQGIHVWFIGEHAFVRMDARHQPQLAALVARLEDERITTAQIAGAWGTEETTKGLVYYLYPDDLKPHEVSDPYSLHQLALADGVHMRRLFAVCAPGEVDDAYVDVEHEIAFGCSHGDRLVSAGSGYRRSGFLDLGVLTDTRHRNRGLGKAVVSRMCQWAFERVAIPQYRTNADNEASRRVAEGLGFARFFEQDSVWLE
jgi:GNAT superfamily N-acetyltransferase